MKYGLVEHARQRIDVAFGIDAEHVPTLLKLSELCLASDDGEGASNALVKAAQNSKSDARQAREWLNAALRHSPGHQGAQSALLSLDDAAVSRPAPVSKTPSAADAVRTPSRPASPASASPTPVLPDEDMSGEFEDLSIDIDLNLSDFSLDEADDFLEDSSEFELSLDGFELEDLGFDLECKDGFGRGRDEPATCSPWMWTSVWMAKAKSQHR